MRTSTSILSAAALTLGTVSLATAAATAAEPTVTITGTVGEDVSETDPYNGRFLRYVGEPAPEGTNEYYQYGSPRIVTQSPEEGAVTISGTLDLSGMTEDGQVAVIGLNDLEMLDAGDRGDKTQNGIFVAYDGDEEYTIGVTDGDAGGGEFVQRFTTATAETLGEALVADVTLVVDGTLDPATCASDASDVASADGCMTLSLDGEEVASDSYGSVVPVGDGYDAGDELGQGAIPGWYSAYDATGPDVGVDYDLTISPVVLPDEPIEFDDVPEDHVFGGEITWLAGTGITTGYIEDDTFRPSQPVLREQMAAFLYRLETHLTGSAPEVDLPAESPFVDVPASHEFYAEIVWLESTGVTTGYADGTFRPSQPVLREQMAAFIYRFDGQDYLDDGATDFVDLPASHVFFDEIEWLADTAITTGYVDGTFRPSQPVLREQMAAFLFRYDDLVQSETVE